MCHNSLQFLYSKNVFDESAARGAHFSCHVVTLSRSLGIRKRKSLPGAGFDEVTANATYIGSVSKTNANNQCASPSSVPLKSMPMGDWKTRRPKVGITANTCSKISLCRCS